MCTSKFTKNYKNLLKFTTVTLKVQKKNGKNTTILSLLHRFWPSSVRSICCDRSPEPRVKRRQMFIFFSFGFQANASEGDMALALNRYLSTSVLPILTTYADYFRDADHASTLLDSLLHTVYRLSKCKSLTKNQRDMVSDFLVSFTR